MAATYWDHQIFSYCHSLSSPVTSSYEHRNFDSSPRSQIELYTLSPPASGVLPSKCIVADEPSLARFGRRRNCPENSQIERLRIIKIIEHYHFSFN